MWYNVYMKYKTDKQVVFACRYHVVWCVKYRRRILTDAVCDRLKELITRECREMGIDLSDIRISDDHVYLQLDMTPLLHIHKVVKALKARSSHVLREEFAEVRSRLPSLWTNAYFVSTCQEGLQEAAREFIVSQPKQ